MYSLNTSQKDTEPWITLIFSDESLKRVEKEQCSAKLVFPTSLSMPVSQNVNKHILTDQMLGHTSSTENHEGF